MKPASSTILRAIKLFDELKEQVFADKSMTEPARHLADLVAKAGQQVWLYRFSYVAEALRASPAWKGTLHGFEIPSHIRSSGCGREGQSDGC